MNIQLEKTRDALVKRGYEAEIVTDEAAVEYVLAAAKAGANVGWGGSETVKELGLRDKIAALGKEVRDHRTDCDLFLLSANALTTDGIIVNIDGTGNRIAASIFGPKRVIYLVGSNKLVDGDISAAIGRIRREACPPNCRRLGKNTPCATSVCPWFENGYGCESPDRICKATVVFEQPPRNTPTTVLLIDRRLGY